MILSRRWSAFLIAVGVWTWLIWPRFAMAVWRNPRSFADGAPTDFLWVHAALIVASLVIGTVIGVLGVKGWRARRAGRTSTPQHPARRPRHTEPEGE